MTAVTLNTDALSELVGAIIAAQQQIPGLKSSLQHLQDQAMADSTRHSLSPTVNYHRFDDAWSALDAARSTAQSTLDLALLIATGSLSFTGDTAPQGSSQGSSQGSFSVDDLWMTAFTDGQIAGTQIAAGAYTSWMSLDRLATSPDVDPTVQQFFAAGLYSHLTPTQLADAVIAITHNPDPGVSDQRIADLGVMLAAATRGGPGLPAGFEQQVIDVFTVTPDSMSAAGTERPVGLSLVFAHGVYAPDFAANVAGAVVDYWASDPVNPPIGLMIVPVTAADGTTEWAQRNDPLPSLMTMLANNPAAAQRFFTEGFDVLSCNLDTTWIDVDRQTVPVDTRLAWLLTRPWDTGWSDNGAGFGQALEAATTTWRDTDTTGQASARIATQVFALTGQDQHSVVDLSDPLKTSLAAMLAGFMPDVMRVSGWSHETRGKDDVLADGLFTGDRDWDFPPGMPSGVALTQDEVYNLMYGLGHSANVDANLAVVTTGWAVADALSMNYRIQAYQANYTDARNTAQEDMSAMSFLVHAGMDGADAAHAEHEQAAAAMSRALTMLAAIPILKAPAVIGAESRTVSGRRHLISNRDPR